MAKAALILASILLLAFSAGLSGTHPNQTVFNNQREIVSPAIDGGQVSVGKGSAALVPLATKRARVAYESEDVLAPALLVYLAFVLIGGGIAVGFVRHTYRRQL